MSLYLNIVSNNFIEKSEMKNIDVRNEILIEIEKIKFKITYEVI